MVQEFLVINKYAMHKLTFPNAKAKLGRFLNLHESRILDVWTQHVLFSIHRWEFMEWMTNALERGEAALCERKTWSGLVYSSSVAPSLGLQNS